jgi:2-iminobutanoate/2-iminopropanoate deaminase
MSRHDELGLGADPSGGQTQRFPQCALSVLIQVVAPIDFLLGPGAAGRANDALIMAKHVSTRYITSQGANVPAWRETEMALKKTVVEPSWEAKYSYSPAIVTEGGKTVWLAGHVGFVDDSGASLAGNFDAQTRQAFKNIDKTLNRAGGTLKDIVWMSVSVSDGRYSQRFTDIRKEIYGEQFPASTLLTAAAFAVPEIMVEITAIAVVPA